MAWTKTANMNYLAIVNKARRPKFEVHLKIYDLNNVPLVQGFSHIKWHIPHSMHGEHRGRTAKCAIANHRVEYNYGKLIPVRIAIDKNNNLSECPIEFEVLQEFPASSSSGINRDEKITLGRLTLNLSEYVEESEAVIRETGFRSRAPMTTSAPPPPPLQPQPPPPPAQAHGRKRSSLSATGIAPPIPEDISPTSTPDTKPPSITEPVEPAAHVEDGITRRYLMTDSKINSTLKISVLMIQIDGERNYVAPPLKTAPVFGGIAGMPSSAHPAAEVFLAEHGGSVHHEDPAADAAAVGLTQRFPFSGGNSKTRDAYELQDMYRRSLAASWAGHPGDMSADECIEDIFSGGDGFGPDGAGGVGTGSGGLSDAGDVTPRGHSRSRRPMREDSEGSMGAAGDDFLRPEDAGTRRPPGGRRGSVATIKNDGHLHHHHQQQQPHHRPAHRRDGSKDSAMRGGSTRSRSDSLASLPGTVDSERGRSGFKSAKEVREFEVREDMVAWKLPGTAV